MREASDVEPDARWMAIARWFVCLTIAGVTLLLVLSLANRPPMSQAQFVASIVAIASATGVLAVAVFVQVRRMLGRRHNPSAPRRHR